MHPDSTALNEYSDGTLPAADRRTVEEHLATCAACTATVNELREIRDVAKTLDPRDPPVRSWTRLQRAIALEHGGTAGGVQARGVRAGRRPTGSRSLWIGLAAAAALVIATATGLRYTAFDRRSAAIQSAPDGAAADASAQAVEAELKQAETHYEKAIQGLEAIASSEKGALDPQTAATMQKNLAVIDQAITESRAALRAQPASAPAQQSLLESFKAKLALLEDTVALINETRKGNDAGAARIVSGLKSKG
ncbi:MAG TPA: zf-HC2 domain-containing protein [Vicinamibacterales bacterium]|nr:zf-HC2 domain-containing protein [Vicinamibacterales bacterium]